ncbi:CCR4-NOT transcription complex subunit 9 [Tanacetum coccineum]
MEDEIEEDDVVCNCVKVFESKLRYGSVLLGASASEMKTSCGRRRAADKRTHQLLRGTPEYWQSIFYDSTWVDDVACDALRSCLPDMLRDATFSSCLRASEDPTTRRWLQQLVHNVQGPRVGLQGGGERNNRIYGKGERKYEDVTNMIVDVVRLKIASIKFKKNVRIQKLMRTWKISNVISNGIDGGGS